MRWCLIDFGGISHSLLPSWFLQYFPGKSHSTQILISFLQLSHVEGNVNNPITLIIISFSSLKIDQQQQGDWMGRDSVIHSPLLVFRGCDGFMKSHHDPNLLYRNKTFLPGPTAAAASRWMIGRFPVASSNIPLL